MMRSEQGYRSRERFQPLHRPTSRDAVITGWNKMLLNPVLAIAVFGLLGHSLFSSVRIFPNPPFLEGWLEYDPRILDAPRGILPNRTSAPYNNDLNKIQEMETHHYLGERETRPKHAVVEANNSTKRQDTISLERSHFQNVSDKGLEDEVHNTRKHDKSSLTSYMWLNGKPFNPLNQDNAVRPTDQGSNIVIDAVSIGSQYNVAQMEGQAASWGSHWSMRYLFGTTEQDDADPYCHLNMTDHQFETIFGYCQKRKYGRNRLKAIRKQFPSMPWIKTWNKTKGWLCAQQRFAHAVGKVGRFYRKEGVANLPDYLFVQDDDTWFGMNNLLSFFMQRNQSAPHVTAGCIVQWPIPLVNFSFPFGGFGVMLNRNSVERLIQPIYCNTTSADPYTKTVCLRLQENLVGERMAYQDGMSISDLMDRHAAMLPYVQYREWNDPGYCMLGDWVLGYYANFYELGSRETLDPNFLHNYETGSPIAHDFDYLHMDRSLGNIYKGERGTCENHNVKHCRKSRSQYTCHRMKPDEMLRMDAVDARKAIRLFNGTQVPSRQILLRQS